MLRGVRVITFCSMAMAGLNPFMVSTSGLSIRFKNCRAYELRLSAYRRCPSAYNVSIASDDLPDPDTPVITINLRRGISTVTFFKLCMRAPLIRMGERSIRGGQRYWQLTFFWRAHAGNSCQESLVSKK